MKLRLEFLPQRTRRLFRRLRSEPLLEGLVLAGGSALALQIGHRISEDLDFVCLESKLPTRHVDALMSKLEAEGYTVSLMTPQSQIESFRINTGRKLLDYARDYAVEGAKLSFFARGQDAPRVQIEFLRSCAQAHSGKCCAVMGIEGLFAMKVLLLADRARSRDLFDLMALIRDHGFSLDRAFQHVAKLAPIEQRDIERHKAVLTGVILLDADDEGFEGLGVVIGIESIYQFFGSAVDAYEQRLAKSGQIF